MGATHFCTEKIEVKIEEIIEIQCVSRNLFHTKKREKPLKSFMKNHTEKKLQTSTDFQIKLFHFPTSLTDGRRRQNPTKVFFFFLGLQKSFSQALAALTAQHLWYKRRP